MIVSYDSLHVYNCENIIMGMLDVLAFDVCVFIDILHTEFCQTTRLRQGKHILVHVVSHCSHQ